MKLFKGDRVRVEGFFKGVRQVKGIVLEVEPSNHPEFSDSVLVRDEVDGEEQYFYAAVLTRILTDREMWEDQQYQIEQDMKAEHREAVSLLPSVFDDDLMVEVYMEERREEEHDTYNDMFGDI